MATDQPAHPAGSRDPRGADPAWERIRAFLQDHGSVITTAEARRLGLTSNDLRGLVRRGRLERIAHGAYIDVAAASTPTNRHLCASRALVRSRPRVAVSHTSAALLHGLPVLHRDLGVVHLTHRRQTDETRRRHAYVVHRCPGADAFTEAAGLSVVVPVLAVLGTVLIAGMRSGIAAADAALRLGLTSKEELEGWLERMRHTPGLGAARHVVAQASPTAESAAESLARLLLIDLGYVVIPQFRIVDEDGTFVARVDFYLPELGVVIEFDGRIKYEGLEGASALAAEKRREDRIRALGYGMARLVWADLFHPARVRAAVEQAARTAGSGRRGEPGRLAGSVSTSRVILPPS
ncbi:type IV toxin-antitoxin system AbiEi family antitoxin domain-containing protein [Ornithinimicrobium pratense]|uniref:AbiEi antitoxin N-terminal domain-containing protein n=1 Tax=Ornithinimicrobium pratense TaxID=2593973 RepID=A0A5J6V8H2_9MICO|nr:type IV toxin-antitoxin system AbiEi family antitoxin domain-containing protein [Ornithinimicrobium pratense]QFG69644.1 hypothetical protein FY030_13880 [Ornithinimicrobium pratense]